MYRLLLAAVAAMAGATLAHARVEVPVASCGQIIYRGQAGRLTADLVCGHQWGTCYACATWGPDVCTQIQPVVPCGGPSDCPNPSLNKCDGGEAERSVGIYLEPGARLYLDGHSISGAEIGISGVRADGTAGPQRIRIFGPGTVSRTREAATFYNGSIGEGVTLTDSLFGIAGSKVRLEDVNTSGNVIGVSAFETLRATRLTSDGNHYAGIVSYGGARVSASHVTGSAVVDIATELSPRVTTTTCDHSAALVDTAQPGIYAPGPPWGVCSGD
jgi:hypothetical protein